MNFIIPNNEVIRQSANLYSYVNNNPLRFTDPTGLQVFIVGGEAAAELGFRVNTATGVILDSQGNFGIIDTFSAGAGQVGLSTGVFLAYIDAPTIFDVQGGSVEIGGSLSQGILKLPIPGLAIGPYISREWTITLGENNYHGHIYGLGAEASFIGDVPVGFHFQLSFSNISYGIDDILRRVLHGPIVALLVSMFEDFIMPQQLTSAKTVCLE